MQVVLNRFWSSLPAFPPLRYREFHVWLLTLATLDVIMTSLVLRVGGEEANAVARAVIEWGGLAGMLMLKGGSIFIVLAICEYIGRTRHDLGRRVMGCALAANTVPVAMGTVVLCVYASGLAGY